ncbi:uncharacterized protein FFC1_06628 [Fusarium fujikuroi]|nr:uncharacterized protein FFC1_06628 [Fusarium fujikuroi]
MSSASTRLSFSEA